MTNRPRISSNSCNRRSEVSECSPRMEKSETHRAQVDVVLLQVGVEIIGTKDLGDLDELIVVVVTVEEGLLAEDLRSGSCSVRASSAVDQLEMLTIDANMQPSDHMSSE